MRYNYSKRWNYKLQGPIDSISDDEARRRFDGKVTEPNHWFTAIASKDNVGKLDVPEFLAEILPHAEYVSVKFIDQWHRIRFIYDFSKLDGQLFMSEVTKYQYPDELRFFGQSGAVTIENIEFKPNGIVKRTLNDKTSPDILVEEFTGVDVSDNWEEVPKFGDWARLGRFRR